MTETSPGVAGFAAARADVLARIAAACARVGRTPDEVTLVAVSKTVDAGRLRDAVTAGLTLFGENRVQEGAAKAAEVPGARWHLIGPLQSNKARRALEVYQAIQSVDSMSLAERIDRLARDVRGAGPTDRFPVLLEVNVDDDPAKAGFAPDSLPEALDRMAALDALDVRGLMTIGRQVESAEAARPTFVALRTLGERLRAMGGPLGADLSMGMTDDFEVAIEEGATIVRVGRAIFGERPHQHDAGPVDHTH
jgi:PLP dependent protein